MTEEKSKKKTTVSKNKKGYGYKYTDLAQIHEYLESINAEYYQYTERIENDDYIMTVPIIDGAEKEPRRGVKIVDAILAGVNNPAQEQGSALTYARRYSLLMAFGLATEDEDGASLSEDTEMTLEEAQEYKITFGRYKGKRISELTDNYIEYLLDNTKDKRVLKAIELVKGQVPLTEEEKKEEVNLVVEFEDLILKSLTDRESLYKHYGVTKFEELSNEQVKEAIAIMKSKVGK